MGVLYGKYDLLDRLTAYRVRPAPADPPGKFETGTGNFEGMCGVLGALEYLEWVGKTFGDEHAERYTSDYTGKKLSFKLGMSAIRAYEFDLSRALLDILAETSGVTIYGIQDTKRLEERVPTCAFNLKGKSPRQVAAELDGAHSLPMTRQELFGELLAIGRAVQGKDICQFYSHNPATTRLSTSITRSSLGLVRWV
jgi:selenocysteine lyase/cysteine desulfurase